MFRERRFYGAVRAAIRAGSFTATEKAASNPGTRFSIFSTDARFAPGFAKIRIFIADKIGKPRTR